MDIVRRIREAARLTPAEQRLAQVVLQLGERMQTITLKELAAAAGVSVPSAHRFCKKLGLEGFKELKVELARAWAHPGSAAAVDINFPFKPNERAAQILPHMESVYATTLHDTRALLDAGTLDAAAESIRHARVINVYTASHNLYAAHLFCDRLASLGKTSTCPEHLDLMIHTALTADETHAAVVISYSGRSAYLDRVQPLLKRGTVPTIFVGTPHAARLNPGHTHYLAVSDRESPEHRITQFASHIAVQYVLDALFCCLFAQDYETNRRLLERAVPYTRHQAKAVRM